jgi:aryl carrier-like protein
MVDNGSEPTPDGTTTPEPVEEDGSAELRAQLAGMDAGQREEFLGELVRAESETILNNPIALDSNFLEKGLNSLTALELAKTLISRVGGEVPMVAIVENPTPAELGRYLAKEFSAEQDPVG